MSLMRIYLERLFAKKNTVEKFKFKKLLEKNNPKFNQNKIEVIMDNLCCLENYSFCKSHAYSYARLIYCLAYNKYYNSKDFWVATLNHCNTSYRKWVHMRQAKYSGIELTYGSRPWKLERNKLLSSNSYSKIIVDDIRDYFKNGYWIGDKFLPNMYFEKYQKEIKKDNKTIVRKMCKFRGLIAIHRSFYQKKKKGCKTSVNTGDYINSQESYSKKNKVVTFVTIGYDDNLFIDLIIWGKYNFSKMHCLEGEGILNDMKSYPWVSVNKFKLSYIK